MFTIKLKGSKWNREGQYNRGRRFVQVTVMMSRIRIRIKMVWIRNTAFILSYVYTGTGACTRIYRMYIYIKV
jgi:hypothetical protein